MAVTLLARRGTKSQLDGISLAAGEFGFTTDSGVEELYIGTGADNVLIGRTFVGTDADKSTVTNVSGRGYYATDTGLYYVNDGSGWNVVSVSDLDAIEDGTTYGKVRKTDLTDGTETLGEKGHPKQLNDGEGNTITAAEAVGKADKVSGATTGNFASLDGSGNLNDSSYAVDDGATGTTNLWSANKINNSINNAVTGISWREPVLDQVGTEPGSPSAGDRYLVSASGTSGDFVGHEDELAEWDGSAWNFTAPGQNMAVFIGNGDYAVTYDSDTSAWIQFTGAGQVDAGVGLAKTGNTLDVNLGAGIRELPTDEVGIDIYATGGLWSTEDGSTASTGTAAQLAVKADDTTGTSVAPVAVGANGVGVTVDETTIEHTAGALGLANAGVDENKLAASVAGDGLTGGAGSALDVGAGDGISVAADSVAVAADSTTGATVAPVAVGTNGVGVTVDNDSIIHTSGTLSVNTVDGGSF